MALATPHTALAADSENQKSWTGKYDDTVTLSRLAGENADETAAAISKEGFESSKYAIIARWDDFADALGASGLAGTLDCPILLTRLDKLSQATIDELKRLGTETVYVVGGTGAISEQIDKDLDAIPTVKTHKRIWGEYAWDTSLECAKAITEHDGNPNSEAIVAVSYNFQDALSISTYAYHYKVPLLLEDNSFGVAGKLTDSAVSFIDGTEGTIYVAGGYVAVREETIEGVFTGRTSDIQRLYGEDGYDTSNQIATYMLEHKLLSVDSAGIASGGQKAHGVDALAGAALVGKQGGVMLLANGNEAMEEVNYTTIDQEQDSQGTAAYLTTNQYEIKDAYVLGGNDVAPTAFFDKVYEILLWHSDKKDLPADGWSLNPATYTYDGTAKTPTVSAPDNLVKDTDYTVEYKNNVEVGTAIVIITGVGNYKNTVKLPFIIANSPDQYTIDNGALWSALHNFSGKDSITALNIVKGSEIPASAACITTAASGIQQEGSGKIGVFQDGTTLYIAPMNETGTSPAQNDKVVFAPFDSESLLSGAEGYTGLSALTSMNLANLDTSKTDRMDGMFGNCSGLTSLDLSNFDTSNVTDMNSMFSGCSGLTSLDLSNFDTSKVEDMSCLFYGCSSLKELDVTKFDTSSVTGMIEMFSGCSGLTSLDLSNFDTSKVTHMFNMFQDCSSLTSLDLTNFNTSSVEDLSDMGYMFDGCIRLASVTLGKDFRFSGWSSYLPTPDSTYIAGADGNWYDTTDGIGYTPADLATFHNALDKTRTYVATPPTNNYWFATAGLDDPTSETPYKNQSVIDADIAQIKTEIADGSYTQDNSTYNEYKELMTSETYHLYTKWNSPSTESADAVTTGKNAYVEFRIIQVGAHDDDGSAVTFMATHSLPTAKAMTHYGNNAGGWADSEMRTTMTNYVKAGLSDLCTNGESTGAKTIKKITTSGNREDGWMEGDTTQDQFWLLSHSEICGTTSTLITGSTQHIKAEGTQYQWFLDKGITCTGWSSGANGDKIAGINKTRTGGGPAGYYYKCCWLRSPDVSTYYCFGGVNSNGNQVSLYAYHPGDVVPAFAM